MPVVVDFWAAWCGPCRMISPVLEDLAKRHVGDLKVVKVDVDANPGLATRFGAQSIPLLVVIRDGKRSTELLARCLALLSSSGWRPCSPTDFDSGLERSNSPASCVRWRRGERGS